MIRIYDSMEATDLNTADPTCLRPEFLRALMSTKSHSLVSNVHTRFYLAQLGQFYFPVTVNETEYENSYVCSPYTGMISYPVDELRKIDSLPQRIGIRALTSCMGPVLKMIRVNRVACVNNSMLSTNLYPSWQGERLREFTQILVAKFPRHAIMFRSLNFATNPVLSQSFQDSEFQFVPSRLLYVIDPSDPIARNKQNNRIDFRLLRKTPYAIVQHEEFNDQDDLRVKSLYDQLYLEKYSHCNPKFTTDLIRLFRKTKQLEFNGLRASSGQIVGVIATLELNNQFTTPIVGYDFRLPVTHGLYRLLTSLVIKKSLNENKLFNMSSGVGRFKKHRGARPFLEYSAIYTKHLPFSQKMAWHTLSWIMKNIAAPIVQKNEL